MEIPEQNIIDCKHYAEDAKQDVKRAREAASCCEDSDAKSAIGELGDAVESLISALNALLEKPGSESPRR